MSAGPGDRFCGIYHRPSHQVYLYTKGGRGKGASSSVYGADDPALQELIETDLLEQLQEDVELLQVWRPRGGGGTLAAKIWNQVLSRCFG